MLCGWLNLQCACCFYNGARSRCRLLKNCDTLGAQHIHKHTFIDVEPVHTHTHTPVGSSTRIHLYLNDWTWNHNKNVNVLYGAGTAVTSYCFCYLFSVPICLYSVAAILPLYSPHNALRVLSQTENCGNQQPELFWLFGSVPINFSPS